MVMSKFKKKIIPVIKWLSIDLDEVIVDIFVSNGLMFNTIEWRRSDNSVILHYINDDLDFEFNFEDMYESVQKEIYMFLLRNYLN